VNSNVNTPTASNFRSTSNANKILNSQSQNRSFVVNRGDQYKNYEDYQVFIINI